MQDMVAPELTALWSSIYLQNRYSKCNPIARYLPIYGVWESENPDNSFGIDLYGLSGSDKYVN